ncbi:MAG TPA: glutamate racemase, partial [candidate division Zixibacteria bacterium]|nr:glutamate racemase [candidate division Zixibacteria bacterium]
MTNTTRHLPIGVFDSGLGGLTALGPLIERLPAESTIYLGDLAHTPYGDKTPEEISRYAVEGYEFLAERGIKALVVACNSASAVALPALHACAQVPIFDVVNPGSVIAERHSRSRAIGVVGTAATVASQAYVLELKSIDINLTVHQAACPQLAPMIERDISGVETYLEIVRDCLRGLPLHDIDTLILGCTHYPLIRD